MWQKCARALFLPVDVKCDSKQSMALSSENNKTEQAYCLLGLNLLLCGRRKWVKGKTKYVKYFPVKAEKKKLPSRFQLAACVQIKGKQE